MKDHEPWEQAFMEVQERLMQHGKVGLTFLLGRPSRKEISTTYVSWQAFPEELGLMGSDDEYKKTVRV